MPVGTIIAWPLGSDPSGIQEGRWLECNGQSVNSSKYPRLAALMSSVPDYRGLFLRGLGNVTSTDEFGSVVHYSSSLGTLQSDTSRSIDSFLGFMQHAVWNGHANIYSKESAKSVKSAVYYDFSYPYRQPGMASIPQIPGFSEDAFKHSSASLNDGWGEALKKYRYTLTGDKDNGYSLVEQEESPELYFQNEYIGMRFSSGNVTPTSNENRPVNKAVRYLIKAK